MKMCSFTWNIPSYGVHPVVSCGILPGLWLEIRLEMLSLVVSWFPPRGILPGLWLEIRLEMLPFVVSWFPPRGVMVSTPWCRGVHPVVSWFPPCGVLPGLWLKIRLEMLPFVVSWCRGFHPVVSWCPPRGVVVSTPRGVVVSCLVFGSKLDWKFVSVVSPKWHHGVVSFLAGNNKLSLWSHVTTIN